MSEWLPFVGFTKEVHYYSGFEPGWYPGRNGPGVKNFSDFRKPDVRLIFQQATNVSASVSKVDDFSYRFTVKFRHINGDEVKIDYKKYAVFLIKVGEYRYDSPYEIERNKEAFWGLGFLFGFPGMYNEITVKQVEGLLPNLYDVEFSGVQYVRECRSLGRIFISDICQ